MATNLSGNVGVVARVLHQKGYTAPQIAGIIGRLQQESGQGLSTTIVGDKNLPGGSQGIAQWNRDRLAGLKKFAGDDWKDPVKQAEYLVHELETTEKKAGNIIRKAQTAQEAATGMMHFERPSGYKSNNPTAGHGYANTVKNAANIHAALGGNTGLITGQVANALPTTGTTINSLPTVAQGGVGPDVPAADGATGTTQVAAAEPEKPLSWQQKLEKLAGNKDIMGGLDAMKSALAPTPAAAPAAAESSVSSLSAQDQSQMRSQAAQLMGQLLQQNQPAVPQTPYIPSQMANLDPQLLAKRRLPMGMSLSGLQGLA